MLLMKSILVLASRRFKNQIVCILIWKTLILKLKRLSIHIGGPTILWSFHRFCRLSHVNCTKGKAIIIEHNAVELGPFINANLNTAIFWPSVFHRFYHILKMSFLPWFYPYLKIKGWVRFSTKVSFNGTYFVSLFNL